MQILKIYFMFACMFMSCFLESMREPLSLKAQCIQVLSDHKQEIQQLYQYILENSFAPEFQLQVVAGLGNYKLAQLYARKHDINQDIADLIVERTSALSSKIQNDPSLKSIFPNRMLNGCNNKYLAWALYRQFIENQVRKNEYEKHDRESACLQDINGETLFFAGIQKVLKEKLPEEWHEGIKYFLQRVKKQNNGKKICDMVLSNESNEPIAFFKNYPASFEGDAFFNENNMLILLAGNKRGFKQLVSAESGLPIFALDAIGFPHEKRFLEPITSAYFSNDIPNKLLIETEAGNTYEFTLPGKACTFIHNITAETAAALLVYQDIKRSVNFFIQEESYSKLLYDCLNKKIENMLLHSDAVEEDDYLREKYYCLGHALDGAIPHDQQKIKKKYIEGCLQYNIKAIAIGGTLIAVGLLILEYS